MILAYILSLLALTSALKETAKKPVCGKRAKRVRAVLAFANEDCLLNAPGETNGETFLGFGFKSADECAKGCACKEKGTKFIAFGKLDGFNPGSCFCEKTKTCDKRIDATNIYDVYKVRRNRRKRGKRRSNKKDAAMGLEGLLGMCQNVVSITKKYTGADCDDIKVNGEVYLGSKNSPQACANACSCRVPGTKFITWGKVKDENCGSLGCLNKRACFCEKTKTCSSQSIAGWYDVYEVSGPNDSSSSSSSLLVGAAAVAVIGFGVGLFVKRQTSKSKQIENYEILSNSQHV